MSISNHSLHPSPFFKMNNPFRYIFAALSLKREQPSYADVNKNIDKIVGYLDFHQSYRDNISTCHFDFPVPSGIDCFEFYKLLRKRLKGEFGNSITVELLVPQDGKTTLENVRCFIAPRAFLPRRSSKRRTLYIMR